MVVFPGCKINLGLRILNKRQDGYHNLETIFYPVPFTDALEMQGVQKYYPGGAASVQSLIAGNDILCLPGDVPGAIIKIKEAITNKQMSWADIEYHCKKVLNAKYQYGLASLKPVNTENLTSDLNARIPMMRRLVAENAITLLAKKDAIFFPLTLSKKQKANNVAYVAFGIKESNEFAKRMQRDYHADIFYASSWITGYPKQLRKYKQIVIGIHNLSRSPATNFGLTAKDIKLLKDLQQNNTAITFQFGNAYAAKNWCDASNLVLCYEDDSIVQTIAANMLQGKLPYKGVLPVSVCEHLKYGDGIVNPVIAPKTINRYGINETKLYKIDSIANDAIAQGATPGCVVLVARNGHIVYEKAFGTDSYNGKKAVTDESVYDMASVTKICATTLAVMRLYDQGKLDLKKTLGDYLPWVTGSNKSHLPIEQILLHQAGLVPFIPFYKETLFPTGSLAPAIYNTTYNDSFSILVAKDLYMSTAWRDTIQRKILESPVGPQDKYVYSDLDFIFLGKIVESISGLPLEGYVRKEFYQPMSLSSAGFKPLQRMPESSIMPTENDTEFRHQLLRGYVHDQGAAMFGGVAGHAGLFSNAYDMASILQMLLNGGMFNGRRYIQKETIDLFTAYHSKISRRGYGFDKPEKDNATRKEPYPTLSASPSTFGHTGFTGTCVWADPDKQLIYIFLSNRVNPTVQNTLLNMNVRPKIHEVIYSALEEQ